MKIREKIDVFMSHDWPAGIENHGDLNDLLRKKPFFREDIERKCLGSPALRYLLEKQHPFLFFRKKCFFYIYFVFLGFLKEIMAFCAFTCEIRSFFREKRREKRDFFPCVGQMYA